MGLLSESAPAFAVPTEPPAGVLARTLVLSGEDTVLVLLREQGAAAQEIRRHRLLPQGVMPPKDLLPTSLFAERGLQQISRKVAHGATLHITALNEMAVGAVRQRDRDATGNAKERRV